jgi:uncharacterized membrane protein
MRAMIADPVSLSAALVALVALSEWLDRRTWLRHLGAALLVIVLTALAANLGIIPTYGPDVAVYGAIFEYVAPLGIFWLLLLVDLRSLRDAGGPTLALFLVGAAGTVAGVLLAHWAAGGEQAFGPLHAALAGMFTGTYIGGSVNFNAIALEYRVVENASLYAGAAAVDSAMTTVWMAATLALPRLLAPFWPRRAGAAAAPRNAQLPLDDEIETTSVFDMSVVIALGIGAVSLSNLLADGIRNLTTVSLPSVLILTTFALVLAQFPVVKRLRGARVLGLFAVYLFLAVIGALCDREALVRMGALAPVLGGFVCVLVAVHGLTVFGAAWALKLDPAVAAVASQANIGGGTSALALARSLGRGDLELPAILVGSVGTALGNYLGFLVAVWLGA